MAKPKRASPGVGRDTKTNGPSPDAILKALATEVLDQEAAALVRERRKRNRKRAEGDSVNLDQLDRLYRMRDATEGEVEEFFRSAWLHMTSLFNGLAEQLDIFQPKAPRERKAAFAHLGQMAGLKGEDPTPPQNLEGDEMNQWLGGFERGAKARANAQADLADTLAAALAQPEGTVLDGKTGKPVKPLTKAQQKAADLAAAAKQPDLEAQAKAPAEGGEGASVKLADQPDWSGFDDDPLKWGPEQSRAFSAWYDSLPANVSVQLAHKGIIKAFRARRGEGNTVTAADVAGVIGEIVDEGLKAKILPEPEFEATPEEIAAQAGRKGGATDMVDDDYTVGGIRYPSKVAAKAARGLLESQSAKAARLRDEANVP